MIKNTRRAIGFYHLAIENAQRNLEFQVNQDEELIEFKERLQKRKIATLFHSHIQCFSVYFYDGSGETEKYFDIEDGAIKYGKDKGKLDDTEYLAKELLSIVKKFYE